VNAIPWRGEWAAIASRIEGLLRAGEFFYQSIQTHSNDSHGTAKQLIVQAEKVYDCIATYGNKYRDLLPPQAAEAFNRFLEEQSSRFKGPTEDYDLSRRLPYVQFRVAALAALRSEVEFYLSSMDEQIRTATERALMHLQRCIVADSEYRKQWSRAFKEGETACEKLGGVHLLRHGVWAFKTSAEGARTDLVMGNRIDNPAEVSSVSLGLVLTEWKCARSHSEVQSKYNEAKHQASSYAAGILGGTVLLSPRYLIIVSSEIASRIEDSIEDGVTYRFVNIAVEPSVPSKVARKARS